MIPCLGLLVMSAFCFKARVDSFLHAFSLVWSPDSLHVRHLLTALRSSWQSSLFNTCTCRLLMKLLRRRKSVDNFMSGDSLIFALHVNWKEGLSRRRNALSCGHITRGNKATYFTSWQLGFKRFPCLFVPGEASAASLITWNRLPFLSYQSLVRSNTQ